MVPAERSPDLAASRYPVRRLLDILIFSGWSITAGVGPAGHLSPAPAATPDAVLTGVESTAAGGTARHRPDRSPFVILLSDQRISAIPLGDNREALVDLREIPEFRVDGRLADAAGAYAHLREATVEKLLAAQRSLPEGLRLLIVEGYRPLWLQTKYFQDYLDELRVRYPDWGAERLHVEASKYISPPEVAPHSTGGTVDLTLCTEEGHELDMGTALNATPVQSADACFTASPDISAEARRNRDILGAALRSVGMVNYPTEWWHWSYGDRYWALNTGAGQTRYGPVDLA
ncbi:M15 family metallopeptidase [Micromonospora sp. NPDC003197]